jgi:tetrahydromethanopterin S-methyltransferase subunit A
VDQAVAQLHGAAAAKKCWRCGCLHSSLKAIEEAFPPAARPATLDEAIQAARSHVVAAQYDCLGCEVCFPAIAINTLGVEGDACPAELPEAREGWPPLPGSYSVLRYQAPVAVCTLSDEVLAANLAAANDPAVSIVGTMQTENLGIERLVENVVTNPHIRFLILCGGDTTQLIGHLPGQSLLALARVGISDHRRIIDAPGKRPLLKNINLTAVAHFRRAVEVADLIGRADVPGILTVAQDCAGRDPGPAEPFASARGAARIEGYVPQRMVSDPAGYFVVYLDRLRKMLTLEHFRNDGVLDVMIEGHTAAELYIPAAEEGLVTRLDHAAYLGRELARAEASLQQGQPYVQDAAPENRAALRIESNTSACGCAHNCGGHNP